MTTKAIESLFAFTGAARQNALKLLCDGDGEQWITPAEVSDAARDVFLLADALDAKGRKTMDDDQTYLPEDILGAIELALTGAANDKTAVELITALVNEWTTDPSATRPTKLFVQTVHALGGEYRLNQVDG